MSRVYAVGLVFCLLAGCNKEDDSNEDPCGAGPCGLTDAARYCMNLTAYCGDEPLVTDWFDSNETCFLNAPDTGLAGDLAGDTSACRITHALALPEDPSACAAASPSGGGVCGSPCEVYCRAVQSAPCYGPYGQYEDMGSCMARCAEFPNTGVEAALTGDSLSCRLTYALGAQRTGSAMCARAGFSGGGVCGELCEVYCRMTAQQCTGPNALYASSDECAATCAGFGQNGIIYGEGDESRSGDTVQCRLNLLVLGMVNNLALACQNAGPDSPYCQ